MKKDTKYSRKHKFTTRIPNEHQINDASIKGNFFASQCTVLGTESHLPLFHANTEGILDVLLK